MKKTKTANVKPHGQTPRHLDDRPGGGILTEPTARGRGASRRVGVLISGGLDSCVLLCELAASFDRVYPIYVRTGLVWEDAELYWLRRFLNALRKLPVLIPRGTKGRAAHPLQRIRVLSLPVRDLYDGHWSLTGRNVPDSDSGDPSVYLPGRNLILLTKGAMFCSMHQIGTLALGPLKNNPFPDSAPAFFSLFEKTAALGLGTRLSILTPYLRYTKDEVIRRGRRLPLEWSFSCIRPAGKFHCGACNKCAERQRAFRRAGIADKTVYRKKPTARRF